MSTKEKRLIIDINADRVEGIFEAKAYSALSDIMENIIFDMSYHGMTKGICRTERQVNLGQWYYQEKQEQEKQEEKKNLCNHKKYLFADANNHLYESDFCIEESCERWIGYDKRY